MATKPFTVDGNIVVDEATLSNSTSSLVLPAGSIITGGGTVLDATNSDTDDLSEGTANLYFTDARADARIALQAGANLDLSNKSTTDLSEGTNLYYTDTRADARITAASITDLSDADQSVQTTDNVTFANITTSGYLRGPASFVIDPAAFNDDTGTVVIAGNLQVDGTQTTINSTTVSIDDLNFSIATDAADSAAANGAGITIGGAGATLNYTHATTSWDMNKPLNVTGNIGVSGTVDGVDIATRDAILTSTTTTANAALPKSGGTMTGGLTVQGTTRIGSGSGTGDFKIIGNTGPAVSVGGSTLASVISTYGISSSSFHIGIEVPSNDLNDGFYIATDSDQDGVVDTLAMKIRADGNVGIGTSTPAELLHANGSIRLTTDVSTTRRLYALSGTGAYSLNSSGGAAIAFHRDATNNDEIAFETHWQGNQHAERMRIDNQGNVGIGETTPAGKLEVQNTSVNYAILGTSNKGHYFESQSDDNTDGFEIYQQHGSTATRNSFIVNDNRTGSKSAALVVRGDGNVGIGTSSPVYPLVVKAANPRLQLLGTGTNTGISGLLFGDADTATRGQINYNHSDDSLDVVVNAAERMRIDSSGRVGIGTSTPDTILEIVSSNPILTLRDTGTGFNNGDATLRLAESGVGDTLGGYFDVRLDASMLKFDFTPEGGSSSTYMAINSSDGRVQIGTQIFGAGQIVSRGEFINFNTGIQTVSSGGSKTLNMFTRSPDAEVSATGTVYIAAENSGGSVQIGCIIDFFFSNGTLNTTARETGSSQGTMTFSVQENGAGMSVTVAYSGGLGGAIRFNAGGHASIASYS